MQSYDSHDSANVWPGLAFDVYGHLVLCRDGRTHMAS